MSHKADAVVGRRSFLHSVDESVPDKGTLVVIDGRTLNRECFVRAIELQGDGLKVLGFKSAADWSSTASEDPRVDLVLYNVGSADLADDMVAAELRHLVEQASPVPVVVILEVEDLDVIIQAVDCGVRGCIPASIGIDMLFQATRVTLVGGVLLPPSAVLSLHRLMQKKAVPAKGDGPGSLFTSRETAVAEAMRQGKANKIIAYELNLCEGTVKIHVRNIMKKLNATNRTEAAYNLNSLIIADGSDQGAILT